MYGVKVGDVLKYKNYLSLACEKIGNGKFQKGTKLSDGNQSYEIVGIPFVQYANIDAMKKNIYLLINPVEYDAKDLQGKTLYVVE